ncbi:hypothetical protein NQZ68_018678 [Dissostichus eleginoides]|nr:hypothetical protein NQZ68_018678 [Dissostichus eleginoides]
MLKLSSGFLFNSSFIFVLPCLPLRFQSITVKGHNGPEKINPSKEGFGTFHLREIQAGGSSRHRVLNNTLWSCSDTTWVPPLSRSISFCTIPLQHGRVTANQAFLSLHRGARVCKAIALPHPWSGHGEAEMSGSGLSSGGVGRDGGEARQKERVSKSKTGERDSGTGAA